MREQNHEGRSVRASEKIQQRSVSYPPRADCRGRYALVREGARLCGRGGILGHRRSAARHRLRALSGGALQESSRAAQFGRSRRRHDIFNLLPRLRHLRRCRACSRDGKGALRGGRADRAYLVGGADAPVQERDGHGGFEPQKKFKDKKFAAGCSRDVIRTGAERLGWELEKLFGQTILAMRSCESDVNSFMETYQA